VSKKGDTPDFSVNLCENCVHSTVTRGHGSSQRLIYCSEVGERILWPVSSCTAHRDRSTMTLYEMEKMALFIEPNKDRTGFHARRLTDREIRGDF